MATDADFDPRELPEFPPTDESGDVDLNQIEDNLRLTPLERLRQNDGMIAFMKMAREARIRYYGFDPADPDASE